MAKYIPFLLVLFTIAVPMYLAMRPNPRRAVRLLYGSMATCIVIWAYLCLWVYPKYVFID